MSIKLREIKGEPCPKCGKPHLKDEVCPSERKGPYNTLPETKS